MSELILNSIFTCMALFFAIYSFKRDKKRNAVGFFVIGLLIAAYTYKIWLGM